MNILIVDANRGELDALAAELGTLFGVENIRAEASAESALEWCGNQAELDFAFLETEMDGTSGIELARELKRILPCTRIIFCSASGEYALEAFGVHALGYLIKPVASEDVASLLDDVVPEWRAFLEKKKEKSIRVQAFGDFEIFVEGKNLEFKRQKAKELLAYLVDRHGASVTTERIASILFPEENYDKMLKNRVTAVISSLRATLKGAGVEDMLVKSWNQLAVNTQRFECDAYDYERLDTAALHSYRGEYMFGYEWAEFSTATYDNIKKDMEKKQRG